MKLQKLTSRQDEVMRYILSCWEDGWLPTMRELAEEFEIVVSGAQHSVNVLRRKGWLRKDRPGVAIEAAVLRLIQNRKVAAAVRRSK